MATYGAKRMEEVCAVGETKSCMYVVRGDVSDVRCLVASTVAQPEASCGSSGVIRNQKKEKNT